MDPTVKSALKFDDPAAWEHVEKNVPIFCEHELWAVPRPLAPGHMAKIAIQPGEPRPKEGTLIYKVDVKKLQIISDKINQRLRKKGAAMKIFIGHINNAKDEKDQPPLVAYGVDTFVGPDPISGIPSIICKSLNYIHGKWEDAKEYPERSSDYNFVINNIDNVALVKREPKLRMGMVTYSAENEGSSGHGMMCYESKIGTLLYGGLDMADNMGDKQSTEGPDPTAPPDAMELQGEEKNQAERYMCHYKKNDPVMRHMATQYASMQQAAQEPIPEVAAGKPHEGGKPMEGEEQKGLPGDTKEPKGSGPMDHPDKEVEEKMAAEVLSVQYAQLTQQVGTLIAAQKETTSKLEALQATNVSMTQKYAMEQGKRILTELVSEGVVIKNIPKELERLSKTDDAGRVALANDMRENYAHTEQAPVGDMIGVFDEPTILSNPYAANGNGPRAGTPATPEEVDQAVMYAESHKMDVDKDWDKILQEIRKVG